MWPAGRHVTFDNREATLLPPPHLKTLSPEILDPGKEGSFAKYTLNKRLPAVVERYPHDHHPRLRTIQDEKLSKHALATCY